MKKQDYFNKRLEGMLKGDIKRSKAAQIRLKRGYKKAFQLIEDDIAKYVARLSGDLNLDMKSLKRKMTKDEIYALASSLGNEEAVMARYENLSYAEAIRLEMVKNLKEMAKENESLIFDSLYKTYEHNYYSTSYLLYRTMDDFSFTKRVTKEYFDWIAKNPWTSDGKTFSDRIWKDQGKLVDELYKEFTVAATRGANFKEASKRMSRKMNVSYKKCLRLLNTEDSFFSNKAVMDAYKKTTADEYMILATLDRRTCEICGSQDTNHYKIKDAKIGINMPPFHPNCRCTTTVYFEDDDLPGERMMRDDKGKSVKTDYMNYDEWKKKYVDKVDDNADKVGIKNIRNLKFKKAETIKEANMFAETMGFSADYKGIDIECANEWNKGLYDMMVDYPEITNEIKFVGSSQARNKRIREAATEYYKNKYIEAGCDVETAKKLAKKQGRGIIGNVPHVEMASSISNNNLKQLQNEELRTILANYRGITMNKSYFNDSAKVNSSGKLQEENKWHPIGCNNSKSTFDHEFGHQIDSWLNVREDKEVVDLFAGQSNEDIKNGLSGYACTNVGEFVAEAWSEYRNNPEPRKIATKVGKAVEKLWKLWKKEQ